MGRGLPLGSPFQIMISSSGMIRMEAGRMNKATILNLVKLLSLSINPPIKARVKRMKKLLMTLSKYLMVARQAKSPIRIIRKLTNLKNKLLLNETSMLVSS